MVEIARKSVRRTVDHWRKLIKESGESRTKIHLIDKISDMSVRTLLMTATGEDISEDPVDFWSNGKLEKRTIAYSLRETF